MNRSYSKIRHIQESNLRLEKRLVKEALGGGEYDSDFVTKMMSQYPNGIKTTMKSTGQATFANGIDTINGNNPEIKRIFNTILAACKVGKNLVCTEKVDVVIGGGASAVGNAQGYDNKALATRRRDNFINWLNTRDAIMMNKQFIIIKQGPTAVGKATVKDSAAAQAEQYVSASIDSVVYINPTAQKGDNTNAGQPNYKQGPEFTNPLDLTRKQGKLKRVCVKIPENLVDAYRAKVREFKQEQKLGDIPFGIYDVK